MLSSVSPIRDGMVPMKVSLDGVSAGSVRSLNSLTYTCRNGSSNGTGSTSSCREDPAARQPTTASSSQYPIMCIYQLYELSAIVAVEDLKHSIQRLLFGRVLAEGAPQQVKLC